MQYIPLSKEYQLFVIASQSGLGRLANQLGIRRRVQMNIFFFCITLNTCVMFVC